MIQQEADIDEDVETQLQELTREFRDYSGADLVFHRDALPEGKYHDVLKPLSNVVRASAARICLEEVKMYPRDYFADVGLKAIGVFAACASKTSTDRSRPFDAQLGGFRYFGVYNGSDAVAAAFYSDGQLALTFHHEVFHHVDSTVEGDTAAWQLSSDDAFYQAAISGQRPYQAPPVAGDDLEDLRSRCIGYTLRDAVSDYAAKNSREDQAETARHLMSMLPNALVQAIDEPELPGSQRILHVLREYEQSLPDGPNFDWFVDVALQRAKPEKRFSTVNELLVSFRQYAARGPKGYPRIAADRRGARAVLRAAVRASTDETSAEEAAELTKLATVVTGALMLERIRPDKNQKHFDIWGSEDADGVNRTLRHDVAQFAGDAKRLKWICDRHAPDQDWAADQLTRSQLERLRMLTNYYRFIRDQWSVTPGTKAVFDSACEIVLDSLPADQSDLARELKNASLSELAGELAKLGVLE
ncbi:MAG: hypothetical protein ACR2NZ_14140 [Rubripirellula sp.]